MLRRWLVIVAFLFAPVGIDAAGGELRATLVDELIEIYPDVTPPPVTEFTIHTPRGVPAGVHLILTGVTPGLPIDLRLSSYDGTALDARWFRFIDVPVEENTGLASRTEQFDGDRNPHVIRRAPFRIFEAMRPVTPPIDAETTVVACRVELPITAAATPGSRTCTLHIRHADQRLELLIRLRIHDAVVPPIGRDSLHYTNWFSPAEVATRHDLEPWSEAFWAMLEQYAVLMARGRQNTFWVRWSDMFTLQADGRLVLLRERLIRYIRTFDDAGLHWIEGAPVANRPNGDWSRPDLNLRILNVPATGTEGRAALAEMAGQLREVMDADGWSSRWIQHLADEPTDTNAADYAAFATMMREQLPGVPILEATMSRELAGAVDIWCPQVQKYQAHREFFEERRAAGDRLWVYTCLVPGGPWLNRLLDQERLRQTYVGWSLIRYDLDGYLHWGLNHYKADPFEHSVVDHPAMPNTTNKLPAGDSHVVYPGPDGPWTGHRFEAHRIGMEDAELLRLLHDHDPHRASSIVQRVFRSFDDYDTDIKAYRTARRKLLEALDER